jgi:Sec-independent protein translocase protein TatA
VSLQEAHQSRQNIFLGDLRKSLSEIRTESQKRINDYQNQHAAIDKEVAAAEKKLTKSKDQLEKCLEHKARSYPPKPPPLIIYFIKTIFF